MNSVSANATHRTIAIAIFLLISVLLWLFARHARAHQGRTLRPIPAFDAIKGLLGRVAESGKLVHLALGTGGISDAQLSVAASGLAVLRYLANQGVLFSTTPLTTVADPTLMLVAQDVLYHAYKKRGLEDNYRSTDVQLIAPEATAFAVGAQDVINGENVTANLMIGHLGEEYLLLGEAGAQRDLVQMAGSDMVNTQPLMMFTTRNALLGEEVFAAGAYLTHEPRYLASLHVQDVLRVCIVILVILGVLWKTVLG